jgi:SAM-dependent methyltransferase
MDLVRPGSVLDVGCGHGTWLAAFVRAGATTIAGVDGPHVAPGDLEIPTDAFEPHDLTAPLALGRTFDLVVSLEVGEHLPAAVAPAFVASLVAHAPVVLFSAAIPFQGGAGHVNERWPSYWAELFARHGYEPFDVVRPAVWSDPNVAFWYAQNTVLYADRDHLPEGLRGRAAASLDHLDLVHPALHLRANTAPRGRAAPPSLSRLLREVPGAARRAVRARTRRSGKTSGSAS